MQEERLLFNMIVGFSITMSSTS